MDNDKIIKVIDKRWSPVSFSSECIEDDKLSLLFEAARLAPSSNNEQPWLFVYATRDNQRAFNDFLELVNESNRIWARHAWALIISFARMISSYKGRPNRYAVYDTGMAVGNLLAQATAMDIYIHQMGGFSVEKTREYFNLDDNIQPLTVMAAGYLGDGSLLPSEIAVKDKSRKPRMPAGAFTFREKLPENFTKSLKDS
jgi:nitroreductase